MSIFIIYTSISLLYHLRKYHIIVLTVIKILIITKVDGVMKNPTNYYLKKPLLVKYNELSLELLNLHEKNNKNKNVEIEL